MSDNQKKKNNNNNELLYNHNKHVYNELPFSGAFFQIKVVFTELSAPTQSVQL